MGGSYSIIPKAILHLLKGDYRLLQLDITRHLTACTNGMGGATMKTRQSCQQKWWLSSPLPVVQKQHQQQRQEEHQFSCQRALAVLAAVVISINTLACSHAEDL